MHAGHVQIQQDQVQVIMFPGDAQGTVQVRGFQQFGAGKASCNHVADSFTEQWVIVGYQYLVHGLLQIVLVMDCQSWCSQYFVICPALHPAAGLLSNSTLASQDTTKVVDGGGKPRRTLPTSSARAVLR